MSENVYHLNHALRNSNHTQGMMMNMREYLLNKQKQIISKNEQIQDELLQIKNLEELLNEQIAIQTEKRNEILSQLTQNASQENNRLLNELFRLVDSVREDYKEKAKLMHDNVLKHTQRPYLTVKQKLHLKNEHELHQQRKELIDKVICELQTSEDDLATADFIVSQQEKQIEAKKRAIQDMKAFHSQLLSVDEEQSWRDKMGYFQCGNEPSGSNQQEIENLHKLTGVLQQNRDIVQDMIRHENTRVSTLPCNLVIQKMIDMDQRSQNTKGSYQKRSNQSSQARSGIQGGSRESQITQEDLGVSELKTPSIPYSSLRRSIQYSDVQNQQSIQNLTLKQSQIQQEMQNSQNDMRKIQIKQDRYDITIHNLQMKILQIRMTNQSIMKQIYKLMQFIQPFMEKYNLLDFKDSQTSIFLNRQQRMTLQSEVAKNLKLQKLLDDIEKYQIAFSQK